MGNKLGWILAAVLVAGLIVVIIVSVAFPGHSGPKATLKEGMLDLHEVDMSISKIVGSKPDGDGNAADNYANAATLAVQNKSAISLAHKAIIKAKGAPVSIDPAALEAMRKIDRHVAAGARKKEMQYLFVYTPKKLDVHIRVEELDKLAEVAGAMDVLGKYYVCNNKLADADNVYKHLLVMGWHMTNERAHIHMVNLGIGFQRTAWDGLWRVSKAQGGDSTKRLELLQRYETALIRLENFYVEKQKIVWNTRPHPGDIFNVIENDKDRAWRVQAVLALGLIKFSASEGGDQDHIKDLLEDLVDAEDPIVAAAAKAAKSLTAAEYRKIGVKD